MWGVEFEEKCKKGPKTDFPNQTALLRNILRFVCHLRGLYLREFFQQSL